MATSKSRLKTLMNCETIKLGKHEGIDKALNFIFHLDPIPKGRARAGMTKNGGIFSRTPTRTREYENLIRQATALQYPNSAPLTAELVCYLNFFVKNRAHGDIDNLAKAILDAMQGVAFANDKQIKGLHMEMYFCNEEDCGQPRTEVILMRRKGANEYVNG